jgi:pimeloyl-ACP methyl ester carboxylesterase
MPLAKLKEVSLNYYTAGRGEPLLLIAGLGVDHMCWIYQVPEFQQHFSVIIFDNRGIGKSTGSIGPFHISTLAEDTVQLMDYLDIPHAHILGYSMGGMIAQELAINHPTRVNKLMLCSTFARPDHVVDTVIQGLKEILGDQVHDFMEGYHPGEFFNSLFTSIMHQLFSESYIKENKTVIISLLKRYLSKLTYGETFLKQLGAIYHHDTMDRLHLIRADTLVMTGIVDRLAPPSCSELLATHIPHATLQTIPGAEHGFNFEQPDLFNDHILRFLLEDK